MRTDAFRRQLILIVIHLLRLALQFIRILLLRLIGALGFFTNFEDAHENQDENDGFGVRLIRFVGEIRVAIARHWSAGATDNPAMAVPNGTTGRFLSSLDGTVTVSPLTPALKCWAITKVAMRAGDQADNPGFGGRLRDSLTPKIGVKVTAKTVKAVSKPEK